MARLQASNTPHGYPTELSSLEYDDAALLRSYLLLLIGYRQFLFLFYLIFLKKYNHHQLRSRLLVKLKQILLVFHV